MEPKTFDANMNPIKTQEVNKDMAGANKAAVKPAAVAAVPNKGMGKTVEEIMTLKKKSAKELVAYGKDIFDVDLKEENGKTWLIKKIGYMIQQRNQGTPLTGDVKKRNEELDKPEKIAELKKAEEKSAPVKSKAAKKATENKNDDDGFRIGSKGSEMFKVLKKGTSIENLGKVGGPAVSGFLAGIIRPIGTWSAARDAKVEKDEKNIWIREYKMKDGKLVKITDKVAKAPVKPAVGANKSKSEPKPKAGADVKDAKKIPAPKPKTAPKSKAPAKK
jgi:hypothetical protein